MHFSGGVGITCVLLLLCAAMTPSRQYSRTYLTMIGGRVKQTDTYQRLPHHIYTKIKEAGICIKPPSRRGTRAGRNRGYRGQHISPQPAICQRMPLTVIKAELDPTKLFHLNGFGEHTKGLIGYKSPGDGHCLLHSLVTSWNSQLVPYHGYNPVNLETLKSMIFLETINNAYSCLPFVEDLRRVNLISGLKLYLLEKRYNQSFGDLVLQIVPNAMNITLDILNQGQQAPIRYTPHENTNVHPSSHKVCVHRNGDHFNGIHVETSNSCISSMWSPLEHNLRTCNTVGLTNTVERLDVLHTCPTTQHITPVISTRCAKLSHKHGTVQSACHKNLRIIETCRWDLPVLIYSNITGALSDKTVEIQGVCKNFSGDIFCVTESWCTSNVPDEAISITGYTTIRRDRRDGRAHGGVCCYVRDTIPCIKVWTELDDPNLDTLWLTIRPSKLPRDIPCITIGVIYHPPKANDWDMNTHMVQCTDAISQKYPGSGFLICGDFNHMKDTFFKTSCHFKQLVTAPTHGKSVIDLVYTNIAKWYKPPHHDPGIGLSRHQVIVCTPTVNPQRTTQQRYIQRRKQGPKERELLRNAVAKVSWEPIFHLQSCTDKLDVFSETMKFLIDECLPVKTYKVNDNDKPWVSANFHALINKRQYYFHSGNVCMYNMYRNKVNRERKSLKKVYFQARLQNLRQTNPKNWWNEVKAIMGTNKKKTSLQGMANLTCAGSIPQLVENINDTFRDVCSDIAPIEPVVTEQHFTVPDEYTISVEDTSKSLSKINPRKAVGPDCIPNWILKDMAAELAGPVSSIWNASFQEGVLPGAWKCADVVPLPKVSQPTAPDKDLRPISLTPVLSKGIESFPRKWLLKEMEHILDDHQYGSRPGCSTVLALAELLHCWIHALETPGKAVRILMLDFRKAFDRVDHNILMSKVNNLQVPEFLKTWMHSFLCERQQRVKVGETTSKWTKVNAGVPQGTLLGPVAFLLHINDLSTSCSSVKYVDDTTVWEACSITGADTKIQTSADQVSQWSSDNNMQLNGSKTKEMIIQFSKKPSTLPPLLINEVQIEVVKTFKLLGVIINSTLTWQDHVDYISSKVGKRLYFIRMLKRAGVSPTDIVAVYVSLVRSVLEYGCEVWHPGLTVKQTDMLELHQKRALRIAFPDTESYTSRLELSGLKSLKHRREDICKAFFIKLTSPTHKLYHYLPKRQNTRILRHSTQFEKPKRRTDRLKRSPLFYGLYQFQ